MRIRAGDIVAQREQATLAGPPVRIPDPQGRVHLQFRRYAGCPICTLHLREFAARHDEIAAAGCGRSSSSTPTGRPCWS